MKQKLHYLVSLVLYLLASYVADFIIMLLKIINPPPKNDNDETIESEK